MTPQEKLYGKNISLPPDEGETKYSEADCEMSLSLLEAFGNDKDSKDIAMIYETKVPKISFKFKNMGNVERIEYGTWE